VNQEMPRLDGNAAGGALARFFAGDATSIMVTCKDCGATSALGALHLYGGRMGMVLRCTKCGNVNLRAVEINGVLRVDAKGARYLTVRFVDAPPS
jgi:predicted nucleic-acid-binding Zn-ribbon protein